ncbi:hypothetical protein KB206_08255 [Microvirga sp. STS02]|uniref:DUF4350 domain-containing protein n=1 Tax=Hymenobacter negativus TaxID=2795026 RepID=UPI0018DC918E|nr:MULTISPECIES: DUF4350 domain-containing protein [Bacteria]MBH8568871.1 hypothetical protein [Hymenobacter negativus]MBR7208605.1 hypothetical protein [Microvirga sp. STS02]
MTSTFRWYLLGLLALFGAYVALEYYRPKPVDWRPTLINKDKIPYGTYVLYDQLPRLLGTDSVQTTRLPIYNQLTGISLKITDALAESQARTITAGDSSHQTKAYVRDITDSTNQPAEKQPLPSAHPKSSGSSGPRLDDEYPAEPVVDTAAVASDSSTTSEDEYEENDEEGHDRTTEHLLSLRANYLFVNTTFEASATDAHALLRFIANGNDVFIVAENVGDSTSALLDTLGVRTRTVKLPTHVGPRGLPVPDSVTVRFTNPALAGPCYRLPGGDANVRFVVDSGRVGRALATDAQGRPVFVRLDYGRGHVYLCSVPIAFTNQFVLRPASTQFAATALSYLHARPTWWDEYQKQGRLGDQSLLRLVSGHEALNTAWYLLIIGGILFVLVEARRRQRIIPTLKPLPNTTLLFTRTVASLYRQGSSHALIAEKKVGLFMDYLRTHFQETSPDFGDENFRERLSQKSGLARPRVDELLRLVNFARTAPQMNDQQLLQLSRALTDFKREAHR